MKIYTKSGDGGETGLFGGTRVSKASRRVASYGDVDELNSVVTRQQDQIDRLNSSQARQDEQLELLERLASEHVGVCFDFGNNLALLEDPGEQIERLESELVAMGASRDVLRQTREAVRTAMVARKAKAEQD